MSQSDPPPADARPTRWRAARFKDAAVWVAVEADGRPAVRGGRVAVRYAPTAGAKIYRPAAASVQVTGTADEALPDGVDADAVAKPASRGSGFGSAGSRTAAQAAAAAQDAQARLGALSPDTILAFTDGACKGNPGPTGAGAYVRLPNGDAWEGALHLGRATNNVGELSAIGLALDLLDDAGVPPAAPVALFCDSSYARGVLTQGWKAKANPDLIADIRAALKKRPGVTVHWVAGHVGVHGNERADQLANLGSGGGRVRRKVGA